MRRFVTVATLSAVALLAACADGDGEPNSSSSASDGGGGQVTSSSAMGPGLSIGDAMASPLEGPLLVNGHVVVTAADVRICEMLTSSLPPACVGPSLTVEGLAPGSLDLRSASGISWTEAPAQLLGEIENGRLVVSGNAIG